MTSALKVSPSAASGELTECDLATLDQLNAYVDVCREQYSAAKAMRNEAREAIFARLSAVARQRVPAELILINRAPKTRKRK